MSALNKQVGGDHYKRMAIQPIEFITKNELLFNEGNIVKYVCRYKNKNGLEDLEKILQYCDFIEEKGSFGKALYAVPTSVFTSKNNLSHDQYIVVYMTAHAERDSFNTRLRCIREATKRLMKEYEK